MSEQSVWFELKKPIRGRFEVVRIDDPIIGVVFNVRHKKRIYKGKTLGDAVGKMLDSINWQNILK